MKKEQNSAASLTVTEFVEPSKSLAEASEPLVEPSTTIKTSPIETEISAVLAETSEPHKPLLEPSTTIETKPSSVVSKPKKTRGPRLEQIEDAERNAEEKEWLTIFVDVTP